MFKQKHCLILLLAIFPLFSFSQVKPGMWHGEFQLKDSVVLSFQFESAGNTIEFINEQERIKVTEITAAGDSVFIKMPVFDSEIRCQLKGDSMTGKFLNHACTSDNIISFKAVAGKLNPIFNSYEPHNFDA